MRVSSNQSDPGYANFDYSNCTYIITLDGMEVDTGTVMTADEEEGYIVKAVHPLRVEDGEIVTKKVFGKVVITKSKGN